MAACLRNALVLLVLCSDAWGLENTCETKETKQTRGVVLLQSLHGGHLGSTNVYSSDVEACASFSTWPDVDDVTCGMGSCTALVKTANNGGRCDVYCASFGHTCAGAYEEKRENCEVKQTYGCSDAITGTSDMLCKCVYGESPSPTPAPPPPVGEACASFSTWPDLDDVTCGTGSCTALVKTANNGGRCDVYCASFGHTCAGAYEETRENCEIKQTYGCSDAITGTSDMLCKCVYGESPSPTPSSPQPPSPSPWPSGETCWDFGFWPDLDGATCGAGSCTALIQSADYGGRCDRYCESFGHECSGAYEEMHENCEIKKVYRCDEAITGTSDILCTCTGDGSMPPAPSVPSGTTLVETPCVELLLIGDYGSRGSTQASVADAMGRVASERRPEAIIGLGDNIYNSGAENAGNMIRWWKDIYTTKSALQRPWYAITGNHDWYTDARVERDFTYHPENNFWRMPGFWYHHKFASTLSASTLTGLTVDMFFIDTMVWMGDRKTTRFLDNNARMHQRLWLDSALSNSTADWKIVSGHHPVYSPGSHGVTDQIFEDLDPLMRRHGVQVYICGHDHSMNYIRYEGLSYIVSGAGGKGPRRSSNEYPIGSLVQTHLNPGFAALKLCAPDSAAAGEVTFFDRSGSAQSTSEVPIAAPRSELTGAVELQSGRILQFPAGQALVPAADRLCGNHTMHQVDKFCTLPEGTGCRVLADQPTTLTCQSHCQENGLACKNGWTEEDEDCQPTEELGCFTGSNAIDAMICECEPVASS